MLVVLFGISLLVFSMIHVMPGDPALLAAGMEASPEVVERLRKEWGLDQPLPAQFLRFLSNAVRGELGTSLRTRSPVAEEIAERLPRTVTVAVAAAIVGTLGGIAAGVVAAAFRGRFGDRFIGALSLVLVSMPSYWLGLMLMLVFSLGLGLLPSIGIATPAHYVLPVATLAAVSFGMIARTTRQAVLDVMERDYIDAAFARGLGRMAVLTRHALGNALLPITSVVGLRFGNLLAGTVLVESVFAVPGLGRLMVDAVLARDFPVIQGAILVVASLFVLVNTATDVVYAFVDPRVRIA